MRSSGRGRLPVWVVRKRSVLRFIVASTHPRACPTRKARGPSRPGAALAARVRAAVSEVVRNQTDAGIDLVNDGEMSKPSYATYVKDRLAASAVTDTFVYQISRNSPELAKRVFGDPGRSRRRGPRPCRCRDPAAATTDVRDAQGGTGRVRKHS